MAVRIRLALHGCKNRPFYHIVVAPARSKRGGRHLEQVGSYDPMPNDNKEVLVGLNIDRIKYWLSTGAQPTIPVYKLLGLAGVLPAHPRLYLEAARYRAATAQASMSQEEGGLSDTPIDPSKSDTPIDPSKSDTPIDPSNSDTPSEPSNSEESNGQ